MKKGTETDIGAIRHELDTDIGAIRHELETSLTSINSSLQIQADDIRLEVTTEISRINEEVTIEISRIDEEVTTEISRIDEEVTTELSRIDEMEEEVEARRGMWPDGAFCFLANGACPAGFNTISGHMRALSLYDGGNREFYITPATFGSSGIRCHGACGRNSNYLGELHLVTCCK